MSTETRPWGSYTVLLDEDDHKVKQISVNPGERLSLQYHHKRDEHWFVVSGSGEVTLDDELKPVGPGTAVDVPRGTKHRIRNSGDAPLIFVEVQTGEYFGEDDIVRLQDDYDRADA